MEFGLETKRMILRKIQKEDTEALQKILGDPQIMYAWEHGFTAEEVQNWIDENLRRYQEDGFSFLAAVEKQSGKFIGVMGPLKEEIEGKTYFGVAYIVDKQHWGKGYSAEGISACIEYVFTELGAEKVTAQIRPENIASRRVAEKLGMKQEGSFIRNYCGKEMPHLLYSLSKENRPAIMGKKGEITIRYLQEYIRAKDHYPQKEAYYFLKLSEEVGELAQVLRKGVPPATDDSIKGTVEEELWDVIYYALAIANMHNIDLEYWIPIKEKINNEKYQNRVSFDPQ